MPTNTLQDGGVNNLWSTDGNWTILEPVNTEDLVMNIAFDVTLDATPGVGLSLDMTGYGGTLAMGINDLDIGSGGAILDGIIFGSAGAVINCAGNMTLKSLLSTTFSTSIKIVMDASSGTPTLDTNIIPIGDIEIDANGATVDLAGATQCDMITLTDGAFDQAGRPITVLGTMDIDGGSLAPSADSLITCTTFELSGGDINTNGNRLTVDADIVYSGTSTVTEFDLTMPNTGVTKTIDWNKFSQQITCLRTLPNVTIELMSSFVDVAAVDLQGDDVVIGTGGRLRFEVVTNDNWWSQAEGSDVSVNLYVSTTTGSPGGDITLNDKNLDLITNQLGLTIVMDSNIDIGTGDLRVRGDLTGDSYSVIFQKSLVCGDLKIGSAGVFDGFGEVTLGDGSTNLINSIAAGNAANDGNAFTFGGNVDYTAVTFNDSQFADVTSPFNQFTGRGTRYATIVMWFWPDSGRTVGNNQLFHQTFSGAETWLQVGVDSSEQIDIFARGVSGEDAAGLADSGTVNEDAWNQLIVQIDSTNDTVSIWLNGSKIRDGVAFDGAATISAFNDSGGETPAVQRFGRHSSNTFAFMGRMRYMGITGGVLPLSPADAALYSTNPESHLSTFDTTGYAAWWKGDEGSGTSVDNGETTAARDLTLTSSGQWVNAGPSTTTVTQAWDTTNIVTVNAVGTITIPGGLTIDSAADAGDGARAHSTTFTIIGPTNFVGDIDLLETAGTTIFDLASKNITMIGAFDGGSIPFTTDFANWVGGTFTNVTLTGTNYLHAWGVTDGGGNTQLIHESSLGGATANVGTGMGMGAAA